MKEWCNGATGVTARERHGRLCNPLKNWGGRRELNPQPSEPQSDALPIELLPPQITIIAIAAKVRLSAQAPSRLPHPQSGQLTRREPRRKPRLYGGDLRLLSSL